MKTAVVTDGKYRASLAAVRALGAAGFRVVVTQTKGEAAAAPASFLSRYAAETRWPCWGSMIPPSSSAPGQTP